MLFIYSVYLACSGDLDLFISGGRDNDRKHQDFEFSVIVVENNIYLLCWAVQVVLLSSGIHLWNICNQ